MTVAELIEKLKEYPQDLIVTGYNASEMTSTVSKDSIEVNDYEFFDNDKDIWIKHIDHLDITGG